MPRIRWFFQSVSVIDDGEKQAITMLTSVGKDVNFEYMPTPDIPTLKTSIPETGFGHVCLDFDRQSFLLA